MKLQAALLGISFTLILTPPCFADTKVSIDYNAIQFKDHQLEINPKAISLGLDYSINKNFSILGNYGVGVSDDTETTFAGRTNFSIDYLYSIYLKGSLFADSEIRPYALAGYTKTKLTGEVGSFDFGQTEKGFSYAVGVDYFLNDSLNLSLDYKRLIDNSDVTMSSTNLGLSFSF